MMQPSLSRHIKEMELQLGGPLFERHSKGMALTASGEVMAQRTRVILHEMEQAAEAVAELHNLGRGGLRIGAVAALGRLLVPRAIGRFRAEYPGIAVSFLEAPDGELMDALRERKIDLMIGTAGLVEDDIISLGQCRVADQWAIFSRADLSSLPADCTDLDTCLRHSWVMLHTGGSPRTIFEDLLKRAGRSMPNLAVETNSVGAQIGFVLNNDVLGWLPMQILSDYVAANIVRTYDVAEMRFARKFEIYRRSSGFMQSASRNFSTIARDIII